jgi:hypothetical protein
MGSANRMTKLDELDRLMNDPNVLLDADRVWALLEELSAQPIDQMATANPARLA